MIINKEGKLFGKISVIDIAVVLIIVILAVGIAVRFSGKETSVVTGNEKIECTIMIKNVRSYTVEALEKSVDVYDNVSKSYVGKITDVRTEDGEYQVNMADGSFMPVVPEDRYNVYLTVDVDGKTSNDGYYTQGNKYLAPGASLMVKTKYAMCQGVVDSIALAQ